ncbi:MAG: hypothetical protein JWP87_224 [Labilithrix sp.]|nr:hypothetical protein [Labilithrix sp.]
MRARVVVVIALLSAACSKPPAADGKTSTSTSTSTSGDECAGIFEAPAGAIPLCDEHVVANTGEIHWRSYATAEARSAVNARYRVASANCPYELTFKPPAFGIASGGRRLATYEASEPEYPKCAKTPGVSHKTVIVVSDLHERD